jgi:hypothetical protein
MIRSNGSLEHYKARLVASSRSRAVTMMRPLPQWPI